MPLQATSGAASYDAFGGGVSAAPPVYIEDVMSTWLYNGNNSTQTITNDIDLAGKGGLVWVKSRGTALNHALFDTARGNAILQSSTTEQSYSGSYITYNSNGFTLAPQIQTNGTGRNYVAWTFREQPKFFDVVTWSGNSVSGRLIPQSLGSAPGCIIVKCTNLDGTNWAVWHRSLATGYALQLQGTNAAFNTKPQWFNSSTQGSSTTFEVGNDTDTNETGNTYVAYLFAHNAGGFGATATDNVISCGTYTGNGGLNPINLGYEAQWVLIKNASTGGATSNWQILDNMRGFSNNGTDQPQLRPNTSEAESSSAQLFASSTGFTLNDGSSRVNGSGETYIYIAIRRGPMKVPTTGTSVFSTSISSAVLTNINSGFVTDMAFTLDRTAGGVAPFDRAVVDRLRGNFLNLSTASTAAEVSNVSTVSFQQNNGIYLNGGGVYANGYVYEQFRRAPSFFDEVCYTGTGSAATINHNLTVVPELIIIKNRGSGNWAVNVRSINTNNWILNLEEDTARFNNALFSSAPTSTTMTFTGQQINVASNTYVAYLFATCAGVSKVGSYTGNGTTQTIDCGFGAGGARFVLIKRTDSTGDWYVYDTARGMTVLTNPYLWLNSTAAEVATLGSVTTVSTGFAVNASILAAINTNAASYIFLAIA